MKLLVMSDTHGDAEVIKRVREANKNVEAIIHCGDSELAFDHPYLEGVRKVRGNCDEDDRFPNEDLFEVEGLKVFVAHGHLLNVKTTIMNLLYRAKEVEAKAAFFGHSHVLGAELVDNMLFVNPGSLLKPRGIAEKSYAVVEFTNHKWKVTAYTDKGVEIFTNTYELTE
ncbi:metallophosphoesterase [Ureibacillus aquaedulcis]|uniref:Phosphoesterase n=1 Tax=Ureibacillus aquaedulcis TaxID=3058421 RepID=A0ABT8GQA3_9BACL|nr:metallophosphoesterase [Ureibacillus sp. BA0131]MDN4493598.1 metallophosphoesterase [Ureibacillus sp. BA0131]